MNVNKSDLNGPQQERKPKQQRLLKAYNMDTDVAMGDNSEATAGTSLKARARKYQATSMKRKQGGQQIGQSGEMTPTIGKKHLKIYFGLSF